MSHLWSPGCTAKALLFGACVTLSPPARAEDAPPSATVALSERRAAEAFQAYSRGQYESAVALYVQAYDAAASGAILYNIARIYDLKLGNPRLASEFYERYVESPGSYADRVEAATQRLAQLRALEQAGSPHAGDSQSKSNAAGENSASNRQGTAAADDSGWSSLRWTGVVLGAAGVVGLGVGTGFGLAARSKANTAHEACDGDVCSTRAGVDAAEAASRRATVSTVAFVAGGALLLSGVTLYLVGAPPSSEQAQGSRLRLSANTSASAATLRFSGSW